MGWILAIVIAVALVVAFVVWRIRHRSNISGAGLICVTPHDFTLSPPSVKNAAERAVAGEPQFHPIEASQDEEGNIMLTLGEHLLHLGRTTAEDDNDPFGLALFYLAGSSSLNVNEAYQLIGKIAAATMPEGTSRLIAPHLGREEKMTDELREKMAEGEFLLAASFYGQPWLVHVDGESKEMKAAVEEARSRWPEFVEAFRNRPAGDEDVHFAVKVPLPFAGETEFIWVEVQEITDNEIRGVLANDSMHDRSAKAGKPVTAPINDLNDWVISRGEEMTGGFTIPILMGQR